VYFILKTAVQNERFLLSCDPYFYITKIKIKISGFLLICDVLRITRINHWVLNSGVEATLCLKMQMKGFVAFHSMNDEDQNFYFYFYFYFVVF